MRTGPTAGLIQQFNNNWAQQRPDLGLLLVEDDVTNLEGHPLELELTALFNGRGGFLPFFVSNDNVVWCVVAPDSEELRRTISDLQAWILPSFGWEQEGDGFVGLQNAVGALASEILRLSPDGYFRWRCRVCDFENVVRKLSQRRHLELSRPARSRPIRPSLYELRSNFATALLLGDRERADEAITAIDLYQLDSATNTQFMRIRMWHEFHEFGRIANHPSLSRLRSQPLPPNVRRWIEEASSLVCPIPARENCLPVAPNIESTNPSAYLNSWVDWFKFLLAGDDDLANTFLREREVQSPDTLRPGDIQRFIDSLEQLFIGDFARGQGRELLRLGLVEFLQDFVREPDFPRPSFGGLYLALLRLWNALHAGISSGREEGHVLLELASAVLRLNCEPAEVLVIIQQWWSVRKVPGQLPFALDAIEVLEREHPNRQAPENLWFEAADMVRREPERLAPSEKILWRRVGRRLGMDDSTINEYLPQAETIEAQDILATANLRLVAIVCLRERQGNDAAAIISERTGAEVIVVTEHVAGQETNRALTADVVLFVWMASTHALFRAFDNFDRRTFCYVQGTGSSSIVRALERWVLAQ